REIRITAALTHPHILPLHDSGEAGGLLYYVMPFVDGETLRERLAREQPLGLETALRLMREVASALAYAHRHGVVHRDIKPANILLEDGHAVVADFGIARAMRQAQESTTPTTLNDAASLEGSGATGTLTHAGTSPGTPAYMAPEHARGDGVADHRADLYALGIIAYEALAGEHPFGARSPRALVRAHQSETPPSLAARRPDLPPVIASLVMQLLAKDPAARPQSAAYVLDVLGFASAPAVRAISRRGVALAAAALLAVVGIGGYLASRQVAAPDGRLVGGSASTGVGTGAPLSLAVLSFENTSGDTAFDYLRDGITDHVRDALNGVRGLTVKARNSSRALTGHDAREVGAKLGVGAVLQGTVSSSNSHLHVTAELVRASDDVSLWSSTFDGESSALAEMQDTIARAITGKLRLAAPVARSAAASAAHARGSSDIEAYDLFLRGRYAFDRLDFIRASELFRAAVVRDPRFARADAYLAMSYANTPTLGSASGDSMTGLARATARRALALDSTVAEAYAAESFALTNELRLADAVIPMEKAVALDS
ncbi:MAG TPA: serine/threonine-protein kinase, partial [Gemmatimonadaceae bacterium]